MHPASSENERDFDLVLVGGGLHNGLIALCALHRDPACRIAMVEAEPRLGGNHTWCVHARDVPQSARNWFDPLIVTRWPEYEVRFPDLERTLRSEYAYVSSERFADVVSGVFAQHAQCRLLTGKRALEIAPHSVQLDDGTTLAGRTIIDARGPVPSAFAGSCGYQKFVGLELEYRAAHGLTHPIMMDACCSQRDGFRFFYVLPLTAQRLLVEETRFSPTSTLAVADGRAAVHSYAARFGEVSSVVREERGVLPMPWALEWSELGAGAASSFSPSQSMLEGGYRAGFFHPATGYSLPVAIRFAENLCTRIHPSSDHAAWQRFLREHRSQATFALHLNRLLFTGFAETDMWGVLARFYRLSEPLIERFYALESTTADRLRILSGWPPRGFSLVRALTAVARPLKEKAGAA